MKILPLPSGRKSDMLSSNDVTANVVFYELDLHFQGDEFRNLNISKTMRACKKMLKYDFYRGWYLPSNGTIANVVLRDLDLHFKVKDFIVMHLL